MRLVEDRTGLALDDRGEAALGDAVALLRATRNLPTDAEVLAACEGPDREGSAFEELVAGLVIRETHFFRNRPQFRALADVVLPELLAACAVRRELRLWSAGCATGEETYSLAMALLEAAAAGGIDLSTWRVSILGTDIDRAALRVAESATYGSYSFRGVMDEERARWFERAGDDEWRVKRSVRKLVSFARQNLHVDPFPGPESAGAPLDLVACRNVTIYFSRATTRRLALRMAGALRDGGWLLVGHAEHSLEAYAELETRALPDVVLYQRVAPLPGGTSRFVRLLHGQATLQPDSGDVKTRPNQTTTAGAEAPVVPSTRAETSVELEDARRALVGGDVNRAVAIAVEIVERRPDDPEACLLLGQVAADRGHGREAEIWLQRALDLRPMDTTARHVLALLAIGRGDRPLALRWLEQALYLEPGHVMAHYLTARLRREENQPEAADRSLRTALLLLEAMPDGEIVPLSHGLTAAQMGALVRGAPASTGSGR